MQRWDENLPGPSENVISVLNEAEIKSLHLLDEIKRTTQVGGDIVSITNSIKQNLLASLYLPVYRERFPLPKSRKYQQAMKYLHGDNLKASPWRNGDAYSWGVIIGWLMTSPLGKIIDSDMKRSAAAGR
jgi:hypothetical protein